MKHNIVHYLEDTYRNYPKRIVCADDIEVISYEELWYKSEAIASALEQDIKAKAPVPIVMKKSCKTLITIWGVIKLGGCYVVIDPMLPRERIDNILKVLNVDTVIVDESKYEDKLKDLNVLRYQDLCDFQSDGKKVKKRTGEICDMDPLYIMFTSGSTGIPKGVAVSHRSVMDFIDCFTELFHIKSDDVIGNQAPWDFDVSVKDIYSAIKVGAKIQIISSKYFSFPAQLMDLLEEKKVTTLIWAVSALCIVSSRDAFSHRHPSYINKVIFSGEVMPIKQFNIWKKEYPEALFVNVYGPTEITCNCTYAILDREYKDDEVLPIGRAFPNERVYLISKDNKLITHDQVHEIGEICVSGTAVALGYYNNRADSAKSFVHNPFIAQYEEKVYMTGDLGYYDEEGNLFFASRKDFQVKHLGHRIELSEIEKAISCVDGVRMNCCIYHNNAIIDFVEGEMDTKSIQKELKRKLPAYMLPYRYFVVDKMPINSHGKIDRKELIILLGENEDGNQ